MSFLTRLNVFARPLCSSLFAISRQNGGRDVITRIGVNACSISSVVEASDLECDEIHEDVKATEKDAALQLAVSQIASEFTKESMLSLKKFFGVRRAPVVSTGSLKLDLALGIGGLPKGRIVEIYGREAAGKTTLALQVIKEAQKLGGYCAFLDVENALDLSLAESIGVNTERLLISHPDCAENLLSMVNTLAKSGAVDVIVIDSVAALLPKCELDHPTIGGTNRDNLKPLMTKAMRKIHYSLSHSRTLIIFLNQVRLRTKSGKANGPVEEVTCGGNALGFHAAVRLRLTRMGLLKTEDKVEGLAICVQVVKNKLAPSATKKAELEIKFGRGFCLEAEVLELACEHGIIVKQDGAYLIEGLTFNSKLATEQYLAKSDEILDKLVMDLRRVLFQRCGLFTNR